MNRAPESLSVVVAIVSDTTEGRCDLVHLALCLEALSAQVGAPALEVIVPYPVGLEGMDHICRRFPGVTFVECDGLRTYTGKGGTREHHDELRARGLAVARGEILGLVEDHGQPGPDWAAAMVAAHRQPCAGVGGAMDNAVNRALNWAVYFCDFGRYQNPLPEGDSFIASDANVTYKRAALEAIRPVWQEAFQEVRVNAALMRNGEKLGTSSRAVVFQHRVGLRLGMALKERFIWGRSYAAGRGRSMPARKRIIYGLLSPVLPPLLFVRMVRTVLARRSRFLTFARASPLVALLTLSWSCGEMCGYLTERAEGAEKDLPAYRSQEPRCGLDNAHRR
jgi:hypothetical protein